MTFLYCVLNFKEICGRITELSIISQKLLGVYSLTGHTVYSLTIPITQSKMGHKRWKIAWEPLLKYIIRIVFMGNCLIIDPWNYETLEFSFTAHFHLSNILTFNRNNLLIRVSVCAQFSGCKNLFHVQFQFLSDICVWTGTFLECSISLTMTLITPVTAVVVPVALVASTGAVIVVARKLRATALWKQKLLE